MAERARRKSGVCLAGKLNLLLARPPVLSAARVSECQRVRAVVSPAQFMETWRKGNQWPARSQWRTASSGNMTFSWTPSRALGRTRQSPLQSFFPICCRRRARRPAFQSLIHPSLMNGLQFRFLQITESVEYFLPFVRPKRRQEVQDFSFAHAQSLRPGTPKDKRSR